MKILGIDPGLSHTGYAILEINNDQIILINAGEIVPKGKKFLHIYNSIIDLIQNYDISLAIIENIFVSSNPKTSILLGQAKGIVLLAFEKLDIQYLEIAPTCVKKFICGKGNVKKEIVGEKIFHYFPTLHKNLNHNIIDAIAIGLSGICTKPLENYLLINAGDSDVLSKKLKLNYFNS